MVKYKIVLAGKDSGLREIIESIIEGQSDMSLVDVLDCYTVGDPMDVALHGELSHSITQGQVNVVIMDYRRSIDTLDMPLTAINEQKEKFSILVEMLLEQHPNITIICLSSLGKRMDVHSEIKLDGVGVHQLVSAIRSLGKEGDNINYQ